MAHHFDPVPLDAERGGGQSVGPENGREWMRGRGVGVDLSQAVLPSASLGPGDEALLVLCHPPPLHCSLLVNWTAPAEAKFSLKTGVPDPSTPSMLTVAVPAVRWAPLIVAL